MVTSPPTNPKAPGAANLARHRVRDGIQELILSGEYQPGERLIQQKLAQRFGVAQGVVRESLLELQLPGLVEVVDNLGMFVSGLNSQVMLEAYQLREMFEGLAARLCCLHASRADLKELKGMVGRICQLGQAKELESMSALDRQFHYRTVLCSRNQLLTRLTEGYRVLGMFLRADHDISEVHDEHLRIVEAIEADRPDEAERLAREHVRTARNAIEEQIAAGTFAPHCVGEPRKDDGIAEPRAGKVADLLTPAWPMCGGLPTEARFSRVGPNPDDH